MHSVWNEWGSTFLITLQKMALWLKLTLTEQLINIPWCTDISAKICALLGEFDSFSRNSQSKSSSTKIHILMYLFILAIDEWNQYHILKGLQTHQPFGEVHHLTINWNICIPLFCVHDSLQNIIMMKQLPLRCWDTWSQTIKTSILNWTQIQTMTQCACINIWIIWSNQLAPTNSWATVYL